MKNGMNQFVAKKIKVPMITVKDSSGRERLDEETMRQNFEAKLAEAATEMSPPRVDVVMMLTGGGDMYVDAEMTVTVDMEKGESVSELHKRVYESFRSDTCLDIESVTDVDTGESLEVER